MKNITMRMLCFNIGNPVAVGYARSVLVIRKNIVQELYRDLEKKKSSKQDG